MTLRGLLLFLLAMIAENGIAVYRGSLADSATCWGHAKSGYCQPALLASIPQSKWLIIATLLVQRTWIILATDGSKKQHINVIT